MAYDKKTFLKNVVIVCDSREKENKHITDEFDKFGIRYITDKKLPFGDYSFIAQDLDFSLSCVIERKANINELYGNLFSDRGRIEKEFLGGSNLFNEFILLLENCENEDYLKHYKVPDWEMEKYQRKVQNIGENCYSTLQSWQCGNRYNFKIMYEKGNKESAVKILERFYWYWRNFKKLSASRRNRG